MTLQPDTTRTPTPPRRRLLRWTLLAALIIPLVAISGFLVWAMTPLGPAPAALAVLQSDAQVTVEQNDWLVFKPSTTSPTTGLVFYPGGRVDYRSYAPQMHDIAAQGYLVIIAPMPLSLAVFAPGQAADIIAAHPEIEHWAIAGHSLGGAMAANFIYTHPQAAEGLALWAAYPADNNSLASHTLPVTSIYGTNDGAAATLAASRTLLPPQTRWIVITGGNHAQFGSYGAQPGDGVATISAEEQRRQTVGATVELLDSLGK